MIKFLNYKEDQLPIRVGYYALKHTKEVLGKDLKDMSDEDFEFQETLLFYALKKGHEIEKKEFKFKREDMEDVMDEVFFDFIKMIPDFFPTKELLAKGKDVKK